MTEPAPPMLEGRLSEADLRTIASRQKILLVLILIYLVMVGTRFVLPPEAQLFVTIPWVLCIIAATCFVFMLAINLYGTGMGVVLGVLSLLPCVGLVVLLVVNSKATRTLREHGIEVGFLGAKV